MGETVNAGIDVYAPAWKYVGDAGIYSEVQYGVTTRIVSEDEYIRLHGTVSNLLKRPDKYIKRVEGEGLRFVTDKELLDPSFSEELSFVPYNGVTRESICEVLLRWNGSLPRVNAGASTVYLGGDSYQVSYMGDISGLMISAGYRWLTGVPFMGPGHNSVLVMDNDEMFLLSGLSSNGICTWAKRNGNISV